MMISHNCYFPRRYSFCTSAESYVTTGGISRKTEARKESEVLVCNRPEMGQERARAIALPRSVDGTGAWLEASL